jgi:hypothetical protein
VCFVILPIALVATFIIPGLNTAAVPLVFIVPFTDIDSVVVELDWAASDCVDSIVWVSIIYEITILLRYCLGGDVRVVRKLSLDLTKSPAKGRVFI